MNRSQLRQKFLFTLPRGLIDSQNNLHKVGKIRLTTGEDEVILQKNFRIVENPDYVWLLLLSQVIIELGDLSNVTAELLEQLFIVDAVYLKNFYRQINQGIEEFLVYPLDKLYQEAAFIAFHFHWSLADILSLEHQERRRWVAEIIKLKNN